MSTSESAETAAAPAPSSTAAVEDPQQASSAPVRWAELGGGLLDGCGAGSAADAEEEEKCRLVAQILELQNTLEDLSSRVDSVKEENLKLRNENRVLGQYIENLMAASSVFTAGGSPKSKRRAQPQQQQMQGKKRAEL